MARRPSRSASKRVRGLPRHPVPGRQAQTPNWQTVLHEAELRASEFKSLRQASSEIIRDMARRQIHPGSRSTNP
eukprot:2745299-Heterocapsa_arctica.AAC.1